MKPGSGISSKHLKSIVLYLIIIAGSAVMIGPFLWMVSTSLKESSYSIIAEPGLIPSNPTLQNFVKAWKLSNFQLFFRNSLFVTLTGVVLVVMISAMMAYAFARLSFPGKELIFITILVVLMVPNIVGIIPQFLLAKTFGLRNSIWGLIIFYVAGMVPFNTFLLRGFFETLPRELEDAVLIDGGNHFTIFFRMVLPLSKPALATVSIFSFLAFWDEFILALTFIDDVSKRTLPVAIATLHGQHATLWGLVFAASEIALIPVILIFVSLQRYFVGGITAGAFK